MREIKFRAWDAKNWRMMHTDIVWGDKSLSLPGITYESWGHSEHADEISDLMQYTGLKDKNGVEIYEGDIVRIGTLEGEPLGAIEWDEKYAQYEINDNDRYKFGGEYVEHRRAQCFEVIGNIYKNPELLNQVTEEN